MKSVNRFPIVAGVLATMVFCVIPSGAASQEVVADDKSIATVCIQPLKPYDDKLLPKKAPYVLAMIKLEGADTSMVHVVEGIDVDKAKIGMKVQAVFAEETTSTLMDIDHFAPA